MSSHVLICLALPALLAAPALGQPYQVGVWIDPALESWSSTPVDQLPQLLEGEGRTVKAIRTSDLLEPEALSQAECLVIPYRAFPAAGHPALTRFVSGDGAIVMLEGDPFARLLFASGEGLAPLEAFGAEARRITGPVDWDLSMRDALPGLTASGEGTEDSPYVFETPNVGNFEYAGLNLQGLDPGAAGLAFEIKGDGQTPLVCLEARELDASRWKQVVTLTDEWREVRLHVASFCSYATEGRGTPGDYLHPEAIRTLHLGLLKGSVGGGPHRFEVRNLRLMQTAVSPADALSPEVPLPGRDAVERAFGKFVAPGPAGQWPSLLAPDAPEPFAELRGLPGSPLSEGLGAVALEGRGYRAQAPTIRRDRTLFPEFDPHLRFAPLLEATRIQGAGYPTAALVGHLGGTQAGSVALALGIEGVDLSLEVAEPLRGLLRRTLDFMQAGILGRETGPRFEVAEAGVEAVFAQPITRRPAAAEATLSGALHSAGAEARLGQVRLAAGDAAKDPLTWLRVPAGEMNWADFSTRVDVISGGAAVDRLAWEVNVRQALRDLCDFLVERAQPDGKFSHVYFIDSRGARTLLAAYEVFGDERYLEAARRWARVMVQEQRPDGGYRMGYGITSRGEECYVADGGEIALGMARVAAYSEPELRAALLESLRRYMGYRDSFRAEGGGIGVGWCLQDYGARPITPLKEITRIMAPEVNLYTITCTLGGVWAYEAFLDDPAVRSAAVADADWLMPRLGHLVGAAAESFVLAHLRAPEQELRDTYAGYLRKAFVDRVGPRTDDWWTGGGGRTSLDLFSASYCYYRLGRDPRLLAQIARAAGGMTARQSPHSIYHLMAKKALKHDEWLYLCFGGLGLAEVVEPGVTLRRIQP